MQYFQAVHSLVHAAIAAALYLTIHYGLDNPRHKEAAVIGALAALPVSFRSSDKFASTLIEKIPGVSRWLRRVLSGKDYLEGDWPLVVVDANDGKPLLVGLLNIEYKGGKLVVSGNDWNPDGTRALTFRSLQSQYENGLLQYFYEQGPDPRQPTMRGYTEIYFFPTDAPPVRHAGEFLDKEHGRPMRFYARKLIAKRGAARPKTDKDRIAAAQNFLREIEAGLPAMVKRKIDSDWG